MPRSNTLSRGGDLSLLVLLRLPMHLIPTRSHCLIACSSIGQFHILVVLLRAYFSDFYKKLERSERMKFSAVKFVHSLNYMVWRILYIIITTVGPVCVYRSVGLLLDHNHSSTTAVAAAFTSRAASDQLCWVPIGIEQAHQKI